MARVCFSKYESNAEDQVQIEDRGGGGWGSVDAIYESFFLTSQILTKFPGGSLLYSNTNFIIKTVMLCSIGPNLQMTKQK